MGRDGGAMVALPERGVASSGPSLARYVRRGLVEEYSVSVDGVRQDLVVPEPPGGMGPLRVDLAVNGACAEGGANGARLVLYNSGRKLAHSRLRVVDAMDRELGARLEVISDHRLAVVVKDAGAVYPVRIDPTFSDANWVSMGGLAGTDGSVLAAVVDASGNLYIGGGFTNAGGAAANSIAKWDGSAWSALGSGMNLVVYALAVSGSNLYAGGSFTTAGGKVSAYAAKAVLAVGPAAGFARTIRVSNSIPAIVFQGTPGSPYDVERAPSLTAPVVWTTLTSTSPLTPGADGLFSFTDTNAPSGTAYYRSGPR